jgi:hypothetical protein
MRKFVEVTRGCSKVDMDQLPTGVRNPPGWLVRFFECESLIHSKLLAGVLLYSQPRGKFLGSERHDKRKNYTLD